MSSTALTTTSPAGLQVGGLGLNSSLFQLKPATLELVQKMTHAEGAIAGKLRVVDTNAHFDEMQVVMISEPIMQRAYFAGEEFSSDSLLCFSTDALEPNATAKVKQALKCGYFDKKGKYVALCPLAKWDNYRKSKDRKDLPPCKEKFNALLVDRVTKLPYYLNIRGKSIDPFRTAMQAVARLIALMVAQGKNPSIFDVSFKIYAVPQEKGTYYTLGFKDFAPVAEDKRSEFGELFLEFTNRRAELQEDAVEQIIDAEVSEAPATGNVVTI